MSGVVRTRRRTTVAGGGGLKAITTEYSPDYDESFPSTSSASFTSIDVSTNATIAVAAGDVLMIVFRGNFYLAAGNNVIGLDYNVDGGAAVMEGNGVPVEEVIPNASKHHLTYTDTYAVQPGDITAGETTVSALWKTGGSSLNVEDFQLTVINLRQVA